MYDPTNLLEVENKNDSITVLKLDDIPAFDIEDYDLMDEKEFYKYVNTIKIIVRSSFEYRVLISYLRENMDMNKCSFFENVNNIDNYKIKIELHHHPFSLYDIIIIVYNKRLYNKESLDAELVAKEVMYLHYSLLVGLIPLSQTVHELVENQYLFIPNDKVMGKYKEFYNMYNEYMTSDIIDVYERTLEFSNSYNESKNMHILDKSYVYVDITGAYDIPTYQSVIDSMSDRINEIKNGDSKNEFKVQNKKKIISFGK